MDKISTKIKKNIRKQDTTNRTLGSRKPCPSVSGVLRVSKYTSIDEFYKIYKEQNND